MDIQEIRKHKQDLEKSIKSKLQELLKEFDDKTGLQPSHINISMLEITRIGEAQPNYVISDVKVDIQV